MKVYMVDEVSCEVNVEEVADLAPVKDTRDAVLHAVLIHAALTVRNTELNPYDPSTPGLLAEPDLGYELRVISYGHAVEISGLFGRDKRWAIFYGTAAEDLAASRLKEYLGEEEDDE